MQKLFYRRRMDSIHQALGRRPADPLRCLRIQEVEAPAVKTLWVRPLLCTLATGACALLAAWIVAEVIQ